MVWDVIILQVCPSYQPVVSPLSLDAECFVVVVFNRSQSFLLIFVLSQWFWCAYERRAFYSAILSPTFGAFYCLLISKTSILKISWKSVVVVQAMFFFLLIAFNFFPLFFVFSIYYNVYAHALGRVQLFEIPWTVDCQAPLSKLRCNFFAYSLLSFWIYMGWCL